MADLPTSRALQATFRTSARLIGAGSTVVGFALALLTANGIVHLARGHYGQGLWMLAAVLGARWLLATALDEWNAHAASAIRDQWRHHITGYLREPRPEGHRSRGDLALAIEQVSNAPSLEILSVSSRVAALGLIVVFWAAGWLSALIIVVLLALAVPMYQRAGRRSAALEEEYNRRRALLESRQLELLNHAPELRSLGAVSYGANEIGAISDSEHSIALRAIRVALGSSLVTEFLSGVSIGLVAMVVGFALLGGRLSLTRALIAVLVTSELFGFVRRFGTEFHRREDADKSLALLNVTLHHAAPTPSHLLISATNVVTAANSSPVTLLVEPGSHTSITGASGSGKTTLLQTLLGWRSPESGLVQRTHATIGFVSAESTLLSGSLWENLTLGVDIDSSIVHQQLDDLGLGGPRFSDLSEPLLADGRGLSSGERVRLVLARTLLARPLLLVLDDIAGVLDASNRERVAQVLASNSEIAIIEASVDAPIVRRPTTSIRLTA